MAKRPKTGSATDKTTTAPTNDDQTTDETVETVMENPTPDDAGESGNLEDRVDDEAGDTAGDLPTARQFDELPGGALLGWSDERPEILDRLRVEVTPPYYRATGAEYAKAYRRVTRRVKSQLAEL